MTSVIRPSTCFHSIRSFRTQKLINDPSGNGSTENSLSSG